MSDGTAVRPPRDVSAPESLTFLCELEPWHRVFLRNLGDLLLRREPPPIETTSKPVALRPGYFIRTGIDPEGFFESSAGHILVVVLLYAFFVIFNRSPKLHSPLDNAKISYYPVSEYLPPLNTGNKAEMKPRIGAPKLAKQEILSVPPEPDNNHQTIVAPPKVKLKQDVPLPNIVAWTPVPAAQPIAASARSASQLKVPQFEPQVVGPAANVSDVKPKLLVPPELQPSVVEPVLSADQLKLKTGQINMAQMEPQVAAPKLPVPAQRASGNTDTAAKPGGGAAPGPSPNVQGLAETKGQGQLIALGLNPADVRGPIETPGGNRSGEFHASPGGKPDAPGTPNVTGSGTGTGKGSGTGTGLPPGLTVGPAPPGASTSAVAGTPSKSSATPDDDARRRMIAAAMKPSVPSIRDREPPTPPPSLEDDPDRTVEQRVFGSKRYYKLVMNMPNLTSATGSWIIHFAELNQSNDKSILAAPVATTKVDPAYPADVLRDHIEGTVTLYAVIRADGTVDDVKVLNSLDSRLDATAARALARWHFRPGTKNGEAVALEAVIEVPFRMKRLQ